MNNSLEEPSSALITAKTMIPSPRRGLIPRTDLIERLGKGQERVLTLVHAPAGYGKSTLFQQWAEEDARRFAWVQLDPSDNDPILLWRYILAALRTQVPGLAGTASHILASPAPDLDAALTDLLNGLLDVPERIVLVLDDYHVIENPDCHRTLRMFIDHLPQTTEVALASRTPPPIPVSRLISRGLLLEIRRGDLQFTPTETEQAVRTQNRYATNADIARIHEKTEGWPTGVYLTAATLTTIPNAVNLQHVDTGILHRYLVEGMLTDVPSDDREFLRETSHLNRLNGELCDHVTGRTDSADVLARLADSNLLLIPLDEARYWYRYHHLLQEVLQADALGDRPGDAVRHIRASEWWLMNGDPSAAIDHAIESGELAMAGDLICAHWPEYLFKGQLETVRRWLVRYPDRAVLKHPPLIVAAAWIAAFRGDAEETLKLARAAEGARFIGSVPDGAFSYESSVALLLAGLALNGVTNALGHAETAYRLERPNSPWKPMAAVLTGTAYAALGETEPARAALEEASQAPGGPDGLATYALGQLALLEASEGNWTKASEYARGGRDLIDRFGLQTLLSSGAAYTASAAVEAHVGNVVEARRQLQFIAALQTQLSDAIPFDAFQVHLVAAETYLVIGDRDSAQVHANAAAASLASLGDGGTLAIRLDALVDGLAASNNGVLERPLTNSDLLTARERQILSLLPSTMSLREIGNELHVSRNTVKTHVSRVYRKLGVSTRTAAIASGRELNLI